MKEIVRNKYIIVVEDAEDDLKLLEDTLINQEYNIKSFTDGAIAWDFLENSYEDICVIILAKTLPNLAGMDLLKKIQEHEYLCNLPVIVQTVDSGKGKYKSAIEQGAQFYIEKPVDKKQLLTLVRASMRSFNNVISQFNENNQNVNV